MARSDPNRPRSPLGVLLLRLRGSASQSATAAKIRISKRTYIALEALVRPPRPSWETLVLLCAAYPDHKDEIRDHVAAMVRR